MFKQNRYINNIFKNKKVVYSVLNLDMKLVEELFDYCKQYDIQNYVLSKMDE